MKRLSKVGICIFAYNEEKNIERCLQSVINSSSSPERLEVTVVVNGTTDNTCKIVNAFSEKYPQVKLLEIKLADKSNAWNEYVYSGINDDYQHFFIDGDNWLPAYFLDFIEKNWDDSEYWGVACLPIGVSEKLRDFLGSLQLISGNGYGVSSEFIKAVKKNNFKIPIGFIGDDSVVSCILQIWNNESGKQGKVQVISSTGPVIPRVGLSVQNIKMLHNRYKRYAIRHLQQEIFYYLVNEKKIDRLPEHSSDLMFYLKEIKIKKYFTVSPIQLFYIPYAFCKIRFSKSS